METLEYESDKLIYAFINVGLVSDFLLAIGMSRFVEYSFMALALSAGSEKFFYYKDV